MKCCSHDRPAELDVNLTMEYIEAVFALLHFWRRYYKFLKSATQAPLGPVHHAGQSQAPHQ